MTEDIFIDSCVTHEMYELNGTNIITMFFYNLWGQITYSGYFSEGRHFVIK